ncbi:hypothetical protein [Sphingobacterium bambusae]|uniref:hypothetical protein n=1 Tax=Sphingobacterium bambusae TaxID=662858 RepID=UPI0036D2838F
MQRSPYISAFILLSSLTSSCQVADLVFHTGTWSGVILVTAFSVVIIWIIVRLMGKRRRNDWTKP